MTTREYAETRSSSSRITCPASFIEINTRSGPTASADAAPDAAAGSEGPAPRPNKFGVCAGTDADANTAACVGLVGLDEVDDAEATAAQPSAARAGAEEGV